jgi:hypothetical protein
MEGQLTKLLKDLNISINIFIGEVAVKARGAELANLADINLFSLEAGAELFSNPKPLVKRWCTDYNLRIIFLA